MHSRLPHSLLRYSLLPGRKLHQACERAILASLPDLSPVSDLWNAQNCPARLLPELAWSMAVPGFDANWPEDIQRAAIAAAIAIHQKNATHNAARRALAALNFGLEIAPGTVPCSFDVTARAGAFAARSLPLTARTGAQIMAVLEGVKPAHTHVSLHFASTARAAIQVVAGGRAQAHIVGARAIAAPLFAAHATTHLSAGGRARRFLCGYITARAA